MMHSVYIILLNFISCVCANGLLLLYRPKDITSECAFSRRLRYDISYGMGMSDTITLIFRTLNDIDYECIVEIVTTFNQYLLVVVRYPTTIALNCAVNKDAITVLKRWRCSRLCDLIERDVYSPYLIFSLKNRLRFLFKSNSSINSDINADFYQVTITSARVAPATGCNERNETICSIEERHFCFTTGVVCDGIKNCGVDDWFDERKSKCNLPVERLGYAPVVAVMAVLLCAFVAGGHMLMRCLPSPAQSFFIFNANEDNRLCIDPLLVPQEQAPDIDHFPRVSVIPVSLSSSENEEENSEVIKMHTLNREGGGSSKDKELMSESDAPSNSRMYRKAEKFKDLYYIPTVETYLGTNPSEAREIPESERKNTVRSMSEKLQDKLKFLTKYASKKHTYDKKAKTFDL